MNAATTVTAEFESGGLPTHKCVVPKLKGKSLKLAKRALKSHFCRLGKVTRAFSGKVKKGHVISQRPKPGKHLKEGAKVSVVLSKGKK